MTDSVSRKFENVRNSISNTVSNGIGSISNNVGNITNSASLAGNTIYNNALNLTRTTEDASLTNASNDFLRSNSIVAKFAFFFLVLIIFMVILNLGINVIEYFMKQSKNPYIVYGSLDGTNALVVTQNPKEKNSVSILRSNNANSGMEFTWTVWLLLKNNKKDNKYRNIFNKGDSYYNNKSGKGVSLVNNGPGLYLSSKDDNQNILHVIMDSVNSTAGPAVINVEGVPFNKWFHVAIRIQNKVLDVYVNGVIASRHVMTSVAKQNYNDINVCQNGGFDGKLSNLRYYSNALSAADINLLVVAGPNLKSSGLNSSSTTIVPYFLSHAWYSIQK